MRFLSRALGGASIFLVSLVLLLIGGAPYLGCVPGLAALPGLSCATDRSDGGSTGPSERVFVVDTGAVEMATVAPEIVAYGEIASGRSLALRAAAAGRLVGISDRFRSGELVTEGEQLFLIDPADATDREADAVAALAEAQAELNEARLAATLAEDEYRAAVEQRRLRAAALERRRGLEARGFTTAEELENAKLSLADAERAVISRDQARASATRRSAQAEQQLTRAEIALSEAARNLSDTEFAAPYSGILQDVDATLGRLVSVNEELGLLIDPRRMEATFRVSDADFAKLFDAEGRLTRLEADVALELGSRTVRVPAVLDRISASADAAQGGRRIYARLRQGVETVLRPGDFVSIRIREPEIEQVAVVPATAVSSDDRVLVVGPNNRLIEVAVEIVRRQGERVIVRGITAGEQFVLKRSPGLGEGVKVRTPQEGGAGSTGRKPQLAEGDRAGSAQ